MTPTAERLEKAQSTLAAMLAQHGSPEVALTALVGVDVADVLHGVAGDWLTALAEEVLRRCESEPETI